MFVFSILFYHIKIQKSIVRCTRSCTPDIFLIEIFIFFCRKKIKRQERKFLSVQQAKKLLAPTIRFLYSIDKVQKYITVDFDTGEKTFVFPSAFEMGFLELK
jgi:hypothetical protein